jgi:putative MFS transporter
MLQRLKDPKILIIIVASLGYFVDIYDLILFNVVKKASLMSIGIPEGQIKDWEIYLFNWQMGGMLAGGILWGILGDTRGRLKVLFGSILMYSLANIANAYVWDTTSYAAVRFIAGVGLAGELGAGITLVAETMKKEERGYGTMVIVTFGALGAVCAALIGDFFTWKTAYWVGGIMGLALLAMRVGTIESGMFKNIENRSVSKGDFLGLFINRKRLFKYINCVFLGLPVWFVVGLVIALSESYFTPLLGIGEKTSTLKAVMYCYIGLSAGDLLSGLLSQWWKSRLKVIITYLMFSVVSVFLFFYTTPGNGAAYYYFSCFILGIGTGYWALFVTVAAEQFGTNIRATVTTTVPNFVRGAVIPITFGFKYLVEMSGFGAVACALIVGAVCIGLALMSSFMLKETFGKDLDYVE